MAFFAYNLLLALAAPVLLPYSLLRGWKRGQPWRRLPERLGRLPSLLGQTAPDSIWLHAVSVGEVLSCAGLLACLRQRFPAAPLFVSTGTATGQQMAHEKLAGKVDGIFYAPLDLPFAVRRVLRSLRPRLVIVAETEIWPNLYRETRRSGAALLLLNGRISDQSAASYRRFRFFFRHVLQCCNRILAQSEQDRERLIAAGAPGPIVTVNGNLKFDFESGASELPADLAEFLARVQPDPLFVAGSTRENEEQPVLEAFRLIAASRPRALLVVAPRHPPRFGEVADLLASSGIPFVRRSALGRANPPNLTLPGVVLLDSLGELASLYRAAQVVFIGGSLNGWGGHNVLEPALYGRPVVVGPHMQNFRAINEILLARDALLQVQAAAGLGPALLRLLENPDDAARLGERGRQVAESQRGATARAMETAEQLYDRAVPRPSLGLGRRILLKPLALLWAAAARLRLAAYRNGWLPRRHLHAFTICIGNLTAGGAGKTPLVAWLVEQLSRRGHNPAVLTRGYRRSSPENLILRPGDNASPADSGDEAAVLLRSFRRSGLSVPLGIGANRHAIGVRLIDAVSVSGPETTTDVIVLDDGFQHLQLERDLDLVLIDVTDPFGNGEMLPLGRLREPVTSLDRAGAIILTRTEPGRPYDELEHRLHGLNPRAPIFRSWTRPLAAVETATGTELSLDSLRGLKIVAFCGLGNPESFWRALRREGLQVVARLGFRDHHRYSASDIARISQAAANHRAGMILTTEKDLVNLAHAFEGLVSSLDEPDRRIAESFQGATLCWLKVETVVERGDELLQWIEARMAGANRPRPARSKAQSVQARS